MHRVYSYQSSQTVSSEVAENWTHGFKCSFLTSQGNSWDFPSPLGRAFLQRLWMMNRNKIHTETASPSCAPVLAAQTAQLLLRQHQDFCLLQLSGKAVVTWKAQDKAWLLESYSVVSVVILGDAATGQPPPKSLTCNSHLPETQALDLPVEAIAMWYEVHGGRKHPTDN